jgi:hypothetical protein
MKFDTEIEFHTGSNAVRDQDFSVGIFGILTVS